MKNVITTFCLHEEKNAFGSMNCRNSCQMQVRFSFLIQYTYKYNAAEEMFLKVFQRENLSFFDKKLYL